MPVPLPTLAEGGKEKLDKFVHDKVTERRVPAFYAGATNAKEPIYFHCEGEKKFGESAQGQINEESTLKLYSSTKLITTCCCLQLWDKGLIDFDDPKLVDKHAPEIADLDILVGYDDDGKEIWKKRNTRITLKQLLSHQSGLGYAMNNNAAQYQKERNYPSSSEGSETKLSYTSPPNFEPGTKWRYSVGIDWAGFIVQGVTGKTLDEYMKENIFTPLGLNDMTFHPTEDMWSKMQEMVGRREDGTLYVQKPNNNRWTKKGALNSGGGGLVGTAKSYLRVLQAVLASNTPEGETPPSEPLFSQKAFKLLFTNVIPPRGPGIFCYEDMAATAYKQSYHDPALLSNFTGDHIGHSVGLFLNTKDSCYGRKAGSGCWDGAAKTQYWLDPQTGIGGLCFTQIMADNPDPFMRTYNQYERVLYDNLKQ